MATEDIRQKLLPRFRETTVDRVERISALLLEWERGAATAESRQELARRVARFLYRAKDNPDLKFEAEAG